jgi:hypothetical protein
MKAEESALKKMGVDYEVVPSGCCGMAGSFGFEKDKYEVSIAAGERVLLPTVRHAEDSTLVIADGFSCRQQIAQTTKRHALHLAEVMQMAMHEGPNGNGRVRPEDKLVAKMQSESRKAKLVARISLAGMAAAGAALWYFNSNHKRSGAHG